MKQLIFGGLIIVGLFLTGCDTATSSNSGGDIIGFYCSGGIQGVYDGLEEKRDTTSGARSIMSLEGIRTDYKAARVDKFVDGYTGYPDHHPLSSRDWTGVDEGFVKLDHHGLNGDGWYLWIFITIQDGEHYVIYANNDHPENYGEIGVHEMGDGFGSPGQVYFYRWE